MRLQYSAEVYCEINFTNWDFTPRGGVFTNTILHELMGEELTGQGPTSILIMQEKTDLEDFV